MKDERLVAALRSLPRVAASPGFRERVLERIDAEPTVDRSRPLLLALAASVLVALCAGLWVGYQQRQQDEELRRSAAAERLEELRREYEQLTTELQELRVLSAEARPFVAVGGSGEYDYLLDLRDLVPQSAPAEEAGHPGEMRPASFRP